ncbi:MAG: hypothetical protein Tsb0020_12660 [Haliangiales bacterium]
MAGAQIGKYEIIDELGVGGMGTVYLAKHTLIGRLAAIKVLNPELSSKTDAVERFFNEARAATAINHPSIVEIYDYGHRDDGSAYIVMEYLQGESLKARIKRLGVLPVENALVIVRQTAAALGAAHAIDIIHRDIKPDNIYLIRDPEVAGGERVRLLDFGIAKMTSETGGNVHTQTGALMGTPVYMSPEQCRGAGHVDARTDFYALGCILYEMLCGQPPFHREGAGAIMAAHIYEEPPEPRSLKPSIPPPVEALTLRLLDKDPQTRLANANALIAEIDAVNHNIGNHAIGPRAATGDGQWAPSSVGMTGADTAPPSTGSSSTLGAVAQSLPNQTVTGQGPRWALVALVAVAIGLALVVTALVLIPDGDDVQPRELVAAPVSKPETSEPPTAEDSSAGADDEGAPGEIVPAVAPEMVEIVIESQPPGARVYRQLDSVQIGTTPHTLEMSPITGELALILEREGYENKKLSVKTHASNVYEVELTKIRKRRGSSRRRSNRDLNDDSETDSKMQKKPEHGEDDKPAHGEDAPLNPFENR